MHHESCGDSWHLYVVLKVEDSHQFHGSILRQEVILDELKQHSGNKEVGVADVLSSRDSSKTARLLRKECRKLLIEVSIIEKCTS